jgi:hypothetical protein
VLSRDTMGFGPGLGAFSTLGAEGPAVAAANAVNITLGQGTKVPGHGYGEPAASAISRPASPETDIPIDGTDTATCRRRLGLRHFPHEARLLGPVRAGQGLWSLAGTPRSVGGVLRPFCVSRGAAHPGSMPGGLLTDLYELNMAVSYLRRGMTGPATFSLFVRRLPPGRGFLIAAGLEDCLAFLERFGFTAADLALAGRVPGVQ